MPAAKESPVHLLTGEAESLWKAGDRDGALVKFDEAISVAEGGDLREMVLVGKGHALLGMMRHEEAGACFAEALLSAEGEAQIEFLNNMLHMSQQHVVPTTDDIASAAGVANARRLHGGALPGGKTLNEGIIGYVEPRASGGGCGDTSESHCQADHGLEGFTPDEKALIEHVAQNGEEEAPWRDLASRLSVSEAALRETWRRIAPSVKSALASSPDMPCGHTCNTCPTRDTCKLHDTLDDIEDM